MGKITNIREGHGFESNEDRIKELGRQIGQCTDEITAFYEDLVKPLTAGEKENIKHQLAQIRLRRGQLIDERNKLQKR